MGELLRQLWYALRRRRHERELAEELAFHRAMKERELETSGATPAASQLAVRRALGSVALARDQVHDVWTPRWLQGTGQDVRCALRALRGSPVASGVAILSLALALGATTAMFGLLWALVFRPLPIRDPNSLVRVGMEPRPSFVSNLSFPAFRAVAEHQRVLVDLIGFAGVAVYSAETPSGLTNAATMGVTANFYAEFDARPSAGRLFASDEFTSEPKPVAVLGYGFWQRAFGGDSAIVGRTMRLDGVPLTIVGVAPKGFSNLNVAIEPAVTVPLPMYPRLIAQRMPLKPWTDDPIVTWVTAVGRLKPGTTIEQARAQLEAIWPPVRQSVNASIPDAGRRTELDRMPIAVSPAANGFEQYGLRSRYTTPFYTVLGIAVLVLVIACVNVASLLLARSAARQQEIAVRVALGAGRGRLVRQLLIEGLMLSTLATVGGLALAVGVGRAFPAIVFANAVIPFAFDPSPDAAVVVFAGGLAVLTAVLFSLAPIWRAARHDPAASLHHQSRTVAQTGRVGRSLVAVQIALCLVLVSASGLLVRSLQQIRAIDVGVRAKSVIAAFPSPRPGAYTASDNDTYYPALVDRVRSMPGVSAAGIAQLKPFGGQANLLGVSAVGSSDIIQTPHTSASPGFFEVLGIGIVSGRDFTWADDSRGQPVAIVSRSLARRLFGDADPIGREIRLGSYADERAEVERVVGVIADARTFDVKDPNPFIVYVPSLQMNAAANGKAIVIRGIVTARDVDRAIEPLGREYVNSAASLDAILDQALLQERLTSLVAGFFAVLALALSAVGVFGLMNYAVVQRRREIGIRMALGGAARRVAAEVVLAGLRVTAAGLIGGLAAAWAATRLVTALLYRVDPHDPTTLTLAPLVLLAVATAACGVPAWRASRIDPARVLRSE